MTPSSTIRFLRFAAVGSSGVLVNLLAFALIYPFLSTIWPESQAFPLSNLASFAVSVGTNFLLNDVWTWKDRALPGRSEWIGRMWRFYLVSSIAGVVQIGVASFLRLGMGVHEYLSVLAGIVGATAINFVVNNFWTYKERAVSSSTPDPAA